MIEEFAPLALQESYDNAGLVVGSPDDELRGGILLAVDVTDEVIDEAVELGFGMIVTHHPIIFHAIKRLNHRSYVEKTVEYAIRNDIALYACHTNLDSTPDGISFRIGAALGLNGMEMLSRATADSTNGFGITGTLSHPTPTLEFLESVRRKLNVRVIRHSDIVRETVSKIAICGGAGASLIEAAKNSGADVLCCFDKLYILCFCRMAQALKNC